MASKGQMILDVVIIIIVLFAIAFASILLVGIFVDFNDDVQTSDSFSNETKEVSEEYSQRAPKTMDGVIFFLLIGLWIALIVSSYFIDSHPIWFAITAFLMIFIFVVAMIIANTYSDITSDPTIAVWADDYPLTNWIFNNFLILMIVISFSSMIAMYAKVRQ